MACNTELDVVATEKVHVSDGRLVFNDVEHFLITTGSISQKDIDEMSLRGLPYISYFSALSAGTQQHTGTGLLALTGLQIVLNSDHEVQIGKEIYRIEDDNMYRLSQEGEILDKAANVQELVTPMDFNQKDAEVSGRVQAGDGYTTTRWLDPSYACIPMSLQYGVTSSFYKVKYGFFTKYYMFYSRHEIVRWIPQYPDEPADYFEFRYSLCLDCDGVPSTPPGITYNVRSVEWQLGFMKVSKYNEIGVGLSVNFRVKPYCGTVNSVSVG